MDSIEKIEKLRKERGWTVYKLALEAGVTQSTLATMYQRNTPPKIETLQALCDAFGVSLAQFFLDEEQLEIINQEEKELLTLYRTLSEEKRKALLQLIQK